MSVNFAEIGDSHRHRGQDASQRPAPAHRIHYVSSRKSVPLDFTRTRFRMYEDVPKIFFPLFYFDQNLPATDELASLLVRIQSLPEVSNIAVLILVTLGLASFVWIFVNMYCWSRRGIQTECKIPQNSNIVEEIPLHC
jgi:hypothetical protein